MLFCAFDGFFHDRVIAMALGIDEECVLPVFASARAFVDMGEIDAGIFKDTEDADQSARFVGGVEEERGLVVAGSLGLLSTEDIEAGDVAGVVFGFFEQGGQAVELAGKNGPDGGGARGGSNTFRDAIFFDCGLDGAA